VIVGILTTMAYVVPRKGGLWEIRESRATPAGPRSHTLATFRVLTPEIETRALARTAKSLCAQDLQQAVVRAGAPIALAPADRAAGELMAELARGHQPRRALRELLRDALQRDGAGEPSANARAAGAWLAASAAEHGEALRDLLLLSDRLPTGLPRRRRRFPRIDTAPA
jgi:hypothetical protein